VTADAGFPVQTVNSEGILSIQYELCGNMQLSTYHTLFSNLCISHTHHYLNLNFKAVNDPDLRDFTVSKMALQDYLILSFPLKKNLIIVCKVSHINANAADFTCFHQDPF